MIPDEPTPAPSPDSPRNAVDDFPDRTSRGRSVILVLAVIFAAVGLLSLAAILATAFLQGTVWPGFVLATYFCLPIAFLLMASLLIWSAVSRRRS
ncbi:hypothetical protein [Arthrobacter agilis]|uniref:hypothetical protein n=1 Tax=Arthrobacter agilis TaxID=37921 RepID=UPI00277FB951|nr:hypothetical protein [Arthrobacter agilis]MDQ0733585.1 putative membrane protein YqjE [Arthrobacter agilis]